MASFDYWVSFRIHNDQTYEKRYDSLISAVQNNSTLWWAETSSFFLVRSGDSLLGLGAKLVTGLRASTDILIMRQVGVQSAAYFGAIKDQDYFSFFPEAKKLG